MQFLRGKDDFFTSVQHALTDIDPHWEDLPGLMVLGSHAPTDVEAKLIKIRKARENKIPFLGICLGMQLMVIEYARNVLGLLQANSTEIDPHTTVPIIDPLGYERTGAFKVNGTLESHWHNYKFNNDYKRFFDDRWAMSYTEDILEQLRLRNHTFFMGVQYHPEYGSSIKHPHPVLKEFIKACHAYSANGPKASAN